MPLDYQCCFCALGVDATDKNAVRISFRNLWDGDQSQEMYAHSHCVIERFGSSLSPSVPFDVEALKD